MNLKLEKNHFPIGPLICTVESTKLPDWWSELDPNIPIIYFSLGSSGDHRIAKNVLKQLNSINASIIVSGSENKLLVKQFPKVYFSHVLPDHLIFPLFLKDNPQNTVFVTLKLRFHIGILLK